MTCEIKYVILNLYYLESFLFRPDFDWNNNAEFTAVESFNLETMQWSHEPDFPFVPVAHPTNVPYGNTFLSVGGYNNLVKSADTIYKVCICMPTWTILLIISNSIFSMILILTSGSCFPSTWGRLLGNLLSSCWMWRIYRVKESYHCATTNDKKTISSVFPFGTLIRWWSR